MQYKVRTDCEVAGVYRKAGDLVQLSEKQAKYLSAPYGREVEAVLPAAAPVHVPAPSVSTKPKTKP